MAGLTWMDSPGCSSALTLIACAGCHPHCRPGQRDKPIVCPLRRDWRCSAPAENYRATNCSCASPERKACDDSLNNPTQTAADFPASKSSAFAGIGRTPIAATVPSTIMVPRRRCSTSCSTKCLLHVDERFDSSGAGRAKMRQHQTGPGHARARIAGSIIRRASQRFNMIAPSARRIC